MNYDEFGSCEISEKDRIIFINKHEDEDFNSEGKGTDSVIDLTMITKDHDIINDSSLEGTITTIVSNKSPNTSKMHTY